MTDSFSLAGLFVALFLPWVCGCVWTSWLLRRSGRCNACVVLGHGFFVGTFFTTLVIRLWDAVGLGLNFWGITAIVLCISVLGILLQVLRPPPAARQATVEAVPSWHIAMGIVLIALIVWRHATLVQELLLRPLYAWDAWMNWAPKAITWFHQGTLVDFVDGEEWLRGGGEGYTLGNRQATEYPITVPLIQLWCMLGVGTWDHSVIFLSWILAPIGLGLALFGHLRLAAVPFLPAVVASYLLLSLPYLNVHSVLAGYADIWLAAAFSLAVCSLYEWQQSRYWGYAVLCGYLALLCSQLKVPGIVLGLIILVCAIRVWLDIKPKLELAIIGGVGIFIVLVLAIGISIDIPQLGRFALDSGSIEIGRFGRYVLEYHRVGMSFLESFFVMMNWNLLWYLLLPWVFYRLYRGRVIGLPTVEILAVLGAFAFVAFIFVLSDYYVAALNFVTLNRALMYPVPAMIFCIFLSFRQRGDSPVAQPMRV